MSTQLNPIALNETSYNVALLHEFLAVLGLSVANQEVEEHKAGPDTLAKVRDLQEELNVPVDDSTLVDDNTIAAIAQALDKKGLTEASRSFTVTGTVKLQDASVKRQQRLLAFELDLRGVAVYRDIKMIAEVESNRFEFLGLTTSDNRGNYSLTFYDWQYRRAERKKADVVVYAVADGEDGDIIGRSRMVNADDYSDKGLVRGLDVTITQTDTRTEYETVMSALSAFLKESETSLQEIAASSEQLAFTAAELDLDLVRVTIAASAEVLSQETEEELSHELLYGIGRQDVRLDWAVLYKKQEAELRAAIAKSTDQRVIGAFEEVEVAAFLSTIRKFAAKQLLKDKNGHNTLNAMLSNALPDETQRFSFLNAVGTFTGSDFRKFWSEHLPAQPEFKDKPELVSNLLLTQQLAVLTGNHQALVNELQVKRGIASTHQLFDLEKNDWVAIIKETGVPDFVKGNNDEEKIVSYAELMKSALDAAFPTQRIAKMVEKNQLPIEKNQVSNGITGFLSTTKHFDFATSRIHDFDEEIKAAAGDDSDEVRTELMKLQRVFQVSTGPEAMTKLLENNLHSAYTIANIPRKSFIKTYGDALGGELAAFAIHERASHVSTRSETSAMYMMEYSHGYAPLYAIGSSDHTAAMAVVQNHVPNYGELFGSPDLCECEHCRSVHSAAAYFVDLLRFLWRGEPNNDAPTPRTPLDILAARRPDLLHLPLTCENTNTIIPYIDLANEVMEYYTAAGSLIHFEGYNTGETTVQELRANPQNFNLEAYRRIKDAKYPFTLPYHQPLDVVRTYSDHLKVSRYEAMKAMNPQPDATTSKALAAESLRLSEEEYKVLTGEAFDGTADPTPLHQYFGYPLPEQLENMSAVPEFLRRSGLAYTDLVELVKTQFINPHQGTLNFLQKLFSSASIGPNTVYAQLKAGAFDPTAEPNVMAVLNASGITPAALALWTTNNFANFQQVITLYEPNSKCDLDTTKLRTIKSIYEPLATSGMNDSWSKIHRFIRLWRKLGWTIHETDLMLAAIGEHDITTHTIDKLQSVSLLRAATRLPLNELAVLWGNIDSYGERSLYKKLFLNKAVQHIDEAFKAGAWGDYLQGSSEFLAGHQSAILAAFRIREEDLTAILKVARVAEVIRGNVVRRPIDINTDFLNLANLSTIYRHVVLAKALKTPVTDLCKLLTLFGVSPLSAPFSTWNIQLAQFTNVAPDNTYQFYKLVDSAKTAGFKVPVLEYILQGTLSPASTNGLAQDKTLRTARAIREAFSAIEQNHPSTPPSPLTAEIITAELALTFQPEIVSRFMGILQGTASFETVTDRNLNLIIPDGDAQAKIDELVAAGTFDTREKAAAFLSALSNKYSYVQDSVRLTCTGVMSDIERATLKGLTNASANFRNAVDKLYDAPASFLIANFNGIFSDLTAANATLLDHPAQTVAATLDKRLAYVYEHFIPILKNRLRRDAITQHIAGLIGLSYEATAVLIARDIETLITNLSTEGFSATYFSDANWTTTVLERADKVVDFAWGTAAPRAAVPADNFSVRWEAYIAAPASGEYTLLVEVEEADEVFKLYLDDTLIHEKSRTDTNTSWEGPATLNAAQMHLIRLDYAETSSKAGVRLQWKRATTALEIVPASVAYPTAILNAFVAQATVYNRAAKFISGFKLSETEVNHLIRFRTDFGNIKFKALTADHWKRVYDYTTLRNTVPQAQALLTDVFALANRRRPVPTVTGLRHMLSCATAWDEASLKFLVGEHFTINRFKNEIALNRLREVMQIVAKTGLSAQTIAKWGAAERDFNELNKTAQLLKNTVKSKYEEEDWLDLAGHLSDKIRENQKQALIAYLLTQPAIQQGGAEDADGLFEYFLIDVQMGACMDTSRIVQANSTVQMFVNRCLLNLESNLSSGSERGVSPSAIDKDRWAWMKNYRVWEANRKVFLYPENWLEPEWRKDRSEFFKDLESYLVQNDITDRSVEQAFRNYLTSLNEVANLEVCGMHRENYDDGKPGTLKYLHVFARTNTAPYKFFYRRWNEHRKWSAWEKVQVDIRSVEHGEDSGVHLIPVAWKKRLFLFWPEFSQAPETPGGNSNRSASTMAEEPMSSMMPVDILEIRLAWSEYLDGKWTPKQVSKEYVRETTNDPSAEKHFLFTASVSSVTQELTILVSHTYIDVERFILPDIQSPVRVERPPDVRIDTGWSNYDYAFSKRKGRGFFPFTLLDEVYLRSYNIYMLLPVDTYKGPDITLDNPFFFSDNHRTYFVRPAQIPIIAALKNPGNFHPYVLVGAGLQVRLGSDSSGKAEMPADATMTTLSTDATLSKASDPSTLNSYGLEFAQTEKAFGGVKDQTLVEFRIEDQVVGYTAGLEFHTFYHPYSSEFVKNLNQSGLSRGNKPRRFPPGLMESDTDIPSDNGALFERTYLPNLRLLSKPADFARPERTYYKENVCFDSYGANSQYNWELFFHAPLYIATRLSKNGKFEEAMKWFHYIFDPTTDAMPGAGESETSRYWKVLPFKTTPARNLEDWFRSLSPSTNTEDPVIAEWRKNPFDPHLVAANRPLAYMKHVVMKYVENLVAWGDSLFRQDTMESVNEALQIYVIANHILGPRPEFVPKRGEIKAESYESLKDKWDDFSNALVQLENLFPYSSEASVSDSSTGTNLLGVGSALYFCIPPNEKLLEYWDTVADRLFKIRHCQNLDGVERKLALFAPPIDPAALILAASQGLSLGSILADLSSPAPIYRFSFLIQKANEFCSDVKALGNALLSALEKKDGEELGRLRASHETQMLGLMTAIKERQVLEAKAGKDNLLKVRETASFRLQHYLKDLLGNVSVTVPAVPTISATLTADGQLPADTTIATIRADVDVSLVNSDENGVKLIRREKDEIDSINTARDWQIAAQAMEQLSGLAHLFPTITPDFKPIGLGAGLLWGGTQLGNALSSAGKVFEFIGGFSSHQAVLAAKMAGYIRREQDWTLQANLAAREIIQLDKQITSADIRVQVTQKELENHKQQIKNAKEVELFLKDKFTNQELYQWMKEQLFAVYKQSYNLAYDMAKKVEKAYQYEMGTETASFIQYGYWDNSTQGLISGDKLQLALRQLEKSYLEENRRELELAKSVSLARLNPLALIELRETGTCHVSLPEELFDLDFRGHYFRRIKAVRLSIPCVVGPYSSVSCSLRLLNNSVRINTTMNGAGNYEHESDQGLPIDDVRFRTNHTPVTAIATSTAQNDSGMFEFNFRDERYLPFERAGAISEWQIELSTEKELRQFDYATISDVILHLDYTARENGGPFKDKATTDTKEFLRNTAALTESPLMQMFSMKHEFSTEWYRFLHPTAEGAEQILSFTLGKERFPFFAQDWNVVVMKIEVLARCTQPGAYQTMISYVRRNTNPEVAITSSDINMLTKDSYDKLKIATIDVSDTTTAGTNLVDLDIAKPMTVKLKQNPTPSLPPSAGPSPAYGRLTKNPPEVEDLYLIVHYKLT